VTKNVKFDDVIVFEKMSNLIRLAIEKLKRVLDDNRKILA
jgi:hypothetical protein